MSGPGASYERVIVHAYAGSKGDEEPRSFDLRGARVEIQEILDRWYQARRDPTLLSASYFKVRSTDGSVFLLKRDNETLHWYAAE